ncbi:MAG: hypothetical protein IVW54_09705 [Candidatus Binataceae bacterium]|nr:hypothetical protein [Candidatus Binataceae bacterium]
MTIVNALRRDREPLPEWLDGYTEGDGFNPRAFFSSRIVYYPGSGDDGHAVKLFASAHAAHAFVYVDQWYKRREIIRTLHPSHPGHLLGYHPIGAMEVTQLLLRAQDWLPHFVRKAQRRNQYPLASLSFGLVAIVERDSDRNDDHGPRRLAIMFLKWDGFAAYDALFCNGGASAPFGVLLQDHGFGGNYDRFGRGGLLEQIAHETEVFPTWLVVAENTEPWKGYRRLPRVLGDPGGMHGTTRLLYRRA